MEDMARLAVVEQSVRDMEKYNKILYELLRHISNILENPHDYEVRVIRNGILLEMLRYEAFKEYLRYVGFRRVGADITYPQEQTLSNLRMSQAAIERKIWFCYGALDMRTLVTSTRKPKTTALKPANILTTKCSLLLKIQRLFNEVLVYEDEELLEQARDQIPIVQLQLKALDRVREVQRLIKTGEIKTPDLPFDIALLMELLAWFKHQYFTWVDQPKCAGCGGKTTFRDNFTITTDGETTKMEVYDCLACGVGAKFVRYNDPRTLLETRRGRCGEWANCFTLLCRSLGYDTRFVYDVTDHVWCEVFDYDSNTWLHADPCEGKLNAPLMYCHGWGKKLSYVIAVSRDDLQDVTWRYTMDHKEVLKRRTECTEDELVACILALREHRQRQVSDARRRHLTRRTLQELVQLMQEREPKDYECDGRLSGSLQWRSERGETGPRWRPHTWDLNRLGACELRYYAASDLYSLTSDGQEILRLPKWSSGVYKVDKVFRKVEHDWKMVYLAREEGAATGGVSWRLRAGAGLRLTQLRLRMHTHLVSSGTIAWTVQYDDNKPETVDFSPELLKRGVSLRACVRLVVSARLAGGAGAGWQHAQLCRQPLAATAAALELHALVLPLQD
ncbi:peptide-N(4)-(N-acetyl-beta-glucosaminyl)asparagine amidase [Helicoverpa zea]|uniref:peptide-N(4)-(N-acetyl-beta- glucosaminyl)asparagine amidase n=1 Tax=Helicoverpa zea TaxID=7113 RepID=UPI001F564EA2|nr:peptide-N(4)-(N-acetyl-beta-glucosaminyl)asparagine amidase [Helicoverpa zea]